MVKNIKNFLENLFMNVFIYEFNIIMNVNFFSDLKFEYYPKIVLQESLKQETKIDESVYEIFSEKKLLGYEIFSKKINEP